ncbi:hypothetical protein SKAU_G00269250 [Synaphobranchus kaupii]|uniref:Uncharacterized protein n=1 Tax=Synaphobranchus kaupii TaxID=118154 RepID=A0A9Q1F013_SYNKA|nr:hypothetical protein SKAU_G00269250 [Synaphobranchus kaupii]
MALICLLPDGSRADQAEDLAEGQSTSKHQLGLKPAGLGGHQPAGPQPPPLKDAAGVCECTLFTREPDSCAAPRQTCT